MGVGGAVAAGGAAAAGGARIGDTVRLGVLALFSRLLVVWWAASRFPPAADGHYYHVLASRLASGQGYTWLWPDGAVSYAAHYPVGLPAMVAPLYAAFGARPWLALALNAVFGALLVVAIHRLLRPDKRRWLAAAGALLVCLHPGLLLYTAAFMTEGITAALLAAALWLAAWGRRHVGAPAPRQRGVLRAATVALALGLVMGATTLVRPQSLLLAPLLAALAVRHGGWRRAAMVLTTSAVCLALVAPWTLRNCQRMERCALVSVNGGWNLLIGTQPEGRGGWSELRVPAECREVYQEAHKDSCFRRAAVRRIQQSPLAWLRLMPAKLSVTFDYCGAPGWYLHESNALALSAKAKWWLGVIELAYERVLLLLALLVLLPTGWPRKKTASESARLACNTRMTIGSWWPTGWRRGARLCCLVAGVISCFTSAAWLAVLWLALGLALRRPPPWRSPVLYAGTLAMLLATVLVHAVFFGAGRYQLVVLPLMAALAPLGFVRARGVWRRWRRYSRPSAPNRRMLL